MSESAASISIIQPSTGSRLIRGTVSAFALNVLGYGFLFLGQLLIARLLTRTEYAEFTVSISFIAILSLIADLGMNPLFVRLFAEADEDLIVHHEDRRGVLLGNSLFLRISLSILASALFFVIAPLLYSSSMVMTMAVLLLSLLISSRMFIVRAVGEAVLRGRGKYYLVSCFALFDAIAFATLMVLATYRHLHLDMVIWIYTLSNIPGFLMIVWSVWKWVRREHITVRLEFSSIRSMIGLSLPLALGTAFLTIATQIDNLLLDKLSTPFEVSSYGATIRLSSAMAPFSLVLAAVTAPELTRLLRRRDTSRARQLTGLSLRVLLVVGVAIALCVTFLSSLIVPLMLGSKYTSASPLLIWTGWMLIPIFIATLLMDLSVAAGATWFMTANAAVAMVVVIVGDFLLIPSFGAIGAMMSKLIAVTLGAGTIVWLSRNSVHFDARGFTSAFALTAIAAVAALAIGWLLMPLLGLLVSTLLIFIVYFIAIHFSHVLPLKEVISLLKRIRPVSQT